MRTVKARWASKLMRARYFVVLTDKESVIAMNGFNPDNFNDVLSVTAQAAALEDFRDKLDDLIKRHEKVSYKLMGGKPSGRTSTSKKKSKAKKINVKEG